MAVNINVQETLAGVLGLVDHSTGTPIPATFANETFTSADETIFTAALTEDDTVTVSGISVGTANMVVVADVSYTDPATGKAITANKIANIAVTISPASTLTDLVVTFGTPV